MTSGLRPIASAIAAAFLITGCGSGSTSAGLASSELPQMQPQLQSYASPAIEKLVASIGGTPAVGTPGRTS